MTQISERAIDHLHDMTHLILDANPITVSPHFDEASVGRMARQLVKDKASVGRIGRQLVG